MTDATAAREPSHLQPGPDPSLRSSPPVAVVIPVHTTERPIERALRSVLTGQDGVARAVVVCHNISPAQFGDRLTRTPGWVDVIELHDAIPSPAGPINAGLDAARGAEAVTVLGSDDYFEPGALAAWWTQLVADDCDVVLMRSRDEGAAPETPHVRPGRRRGLDVVRDRLGYRTGPMMVVRGDLIERTGARMAEGLRTGEDLVFTAAVLLSARRISLAPAGTPMHVVTVEGDDRIQALPFTAHERLESSGRLLSSPILGRAAAAAVRSYAVRTLRRDVIGAALARAGVVGPDDVVALRESARSWLALAGRAASALSRAEGRLIGVLTDAATADQVERAVTAYQRRGRVDRILTASATGQLHPEAPLRHAAAGWANGRIDRRRSATA